jgi:hypothetical protein
MDFDHARSASVISMSRRQILYIQKTDAAKTSPNHGCQKREVAPPPKITAIQNR